MKVFVSTDSFIILATTVYHMQIKAIEIPFSFDKMALNATPF